MTCQRCHTVNCLGPDTKSCSDQLIVTLKARLLEMEDLGVTKGFWGRACARLLSKNASLTKERNGYRAAYEHMQEAYYSFQFKMTERYGMSFRYLGEEVDAVDAVGAAMGHLIYLGNRLRKSLTPQERHDAAIAWDQHLLGKCYDEISPNKTRT